MYDKDFRDAALAKMSNRSKHLKKGDLVRVAVLKKGFQKSSTETYTDELFCITNVLNTFPTTYELNDLHGDRIIGSYYGQELQLAQPDAINQRRIEKTTRLGMNKYRVKYLGWNEKFDDIMDKNTLLTRQKKVHACYLLLFI